MPSGVDIFPQNLSWRVAGDDVVVDAARGLHHPAGQVGSKLNPADAPITNIGVSHYDDSQARFGYETYMGGPWGLRAFCEFARSKGKKFAIGEWGVGRSGDNPIYIQNMYEFFRDCGANLAHEAYFNAAEHRLYPSTRSPRSAELYRRLF